METKDLIAKIVEQNGQFLELLLRCEINAKSDADQAKINDSLNARLCNQSEYAETLNQRITALSADVAGMAPIAKMSQQSLEEFKTGFLMTFPDPEDIVTFKNLEDHIRDNLPSDLITDQNLEDSVREFLPDMSDYATWQDLPDMDELRHLVIHLPDTDTLETAVGVAQEITTEFGSVEEMTKQIKILQKSVEELVEIHKKELNDAATQKLEKPTDSPSNEIIVGS
jgi:hypothetical protein